MSIESALSLTNKELNRMFSSFDGDVREHLEKRRSNGEVLIGSNDCEGFCPIKGCPGHEVKEVTNA